MPERLEKMSNMDEDRKTVINNVLNYDCTCAVTLEIMNEQTSIYRRDIPISKVVTMPIDISDFNRYIVGKHIYNCQIIY